MRSAIFLTVHAMADKPKPDKPLSSDQKLEIREEVERRLKELPASTLKIIQDEIDGRVKDKEEHVVRLFKVTAGLVSVIALIAAAALGFQWIKLVNANAEVKAVHDNVVAQSMAVSNLSAQLSNRFTELQGMDNIVTAQKLKKELAIVESLRTQVEDALLTGLSLSASLNDASAYDKLKALSTNSDSRLAKAAAEVTDQLEANSAGPFRGDEPPLHAVSSGPLTNMASYKASTEFGGFEERSSAMIQISHSTNLTDLQRMDLLVDIALHDPTIYGRVLAVRALNGRAEITNRFNATNSAFLAKWWETSKVNYAKAPKTP